MKKIPYRRPDGRETKPARTLRECVQRCHNTLHKDFKNYGAKGITVWPQWRGHGGYQRFVQHIGRCPSPKYTIDRIDGTKGYVPGNVRWASRAEQTRNRSNTVWLIYDGIKLSISEWAKKVGLKRGTLYSRLKRGWKLKDALTIRPGARRTQRCF